MLDGDDEWPAPNKMENPWAHLAGQPVSRVYTATAGVPLGTNAEVAEMCVLIEKRAAVAAAACVGQHHGESFASLSDMIQQLLVRIDVRLNGMSDAVREDKWEVFNIECHCRFLAGGGNTAAAQALMQANRLRVVMVDGVQRLIRT